MILGDILDIESKMRTMKSNPTYKTIRRNLTYLEEKRFGSRVVKIASPDDLGVNLSMRRNSLEFKDVISRYREKLTEFDDQMNELNSRRIRLVKQLFPGQ